VDNAARRPVEPDACVMSTAKPVPINPPSVSELAEALARMPIDTVLSHRSAAQVWGLWIPRFDDIEITSPATARGSRYTTSVQRRSVLAHRRITAPEDVTLHRGLPVTSLERTWLDLAALLDVHDVVAAGDSALRAGADASLLATRAARQHRLRGTRLARATVGMLDARSRSRPESRIRAAIVLAGLPKPRVNEPIYDEHGQWLAEPDLHYREARVALEYMGADHAELDQLRKDSIRLLDQQRVDWAIRTYTAPHAYRRLYEVVDDVTVLLSRRAPQLLTARYLAHRVTDSRDQRRRIRRL
jgi:hypothetical protein